MGVLPPFQIACSTPEKQQCSRQNCPHPLSWPQLPHAQSFQPFQGRGFGLKHESLQPGEENTWGLWALPSVRWVLWGSGAGPLSVTAIYRRTCQQYKENFLTIWNVQRWNMLLWKVMWRVFFCCVGFVFITAEKRIDWLERQRGQRACWGDPSKRWHVPEVRQ